MLGAIVGDILGSTYESGSVKTKEVDLFSLYSQFTDDSVMTIAISHAIASGEGYDVSMRKIGRSYPKCGYGGKFRKWIFSDQMGPYNSFGNGAAMRVSPVGWAFNSIDEVVNEAKKSAEVTHNHPEGIKGAQSIALAVFMARMGESKKSIRNEISRRYQYDLERSVDIIRKDYKFNISCQKSVPEAIICFLESESYEDTIRNAISLGGDADTQAAIAGSIAEAYYHSIPEVILNHAIKKLSPWLIQQALPFTGRYLKNDISQLLQNRQDEINLLATHCHDVIEILSFPDSLVINLSEKMFVSIIKIKKNVSELISCRFSKMIVHFSDVVAVSDELMELLILIKLSLESRTGKLIIETPNSEVKKCIMQKSGSHIFRFSSNRSETMSQLD